MNVSAKRSLTPSQGVGASFCNILFSISRLDELSIFVDFRNYYIGTISFPSILLSRYLLECWLGAKYYYYYYWYDPSSGNVSLLAFLLCLRVPKSYLSFGLFFWPAMMEKRRFGRGLMTIDLERRIKMMSVTFGLFWVWCTYSLQSWQWGRSL